ncbi:MAG: TIGR03032 family protein [Chthoniobacteraceae bacterium]
MTAPQLEIAGSRNFPSWLREQRASLAFTTYQTGKLFLIGVKPDGKLSIFERTFERCMGLAVSPDAQTLWMSSVYQIWRFENALPAGQRAPDGYDRLYVPQLGYTTGDVDAHDIALAVPSASASSSSSASRAERGTGVRNEADEDEEAEVEQGRPLFVNTLFSCVAAPSETHSFRPVWQPPFITKLAAEDRCHLNGLALRDGAPAFTTAVSASDVHEGWREKRRDGGVIIDVQANEVVCRGLSMPHSPRWHDGKLYVLNSGAGEFGTVDLASGKFEPICFCPGYARGLAIVGHFAVIGLSTCRENRTFSGLPLDDALAAKDVQPRCGLLVVDLRTGDIAHSLTIEGIVRELYDVAVLPGVIMPSALGFKTEEIRRTITLEE